MEELREDVTNVKHEVDTLGSVLNYGFDCILAASRDNTGLILELEGDSDNEILPQKLEIDAEPEGDLSVSSGRQAEGNPRVSFAVSPFVVQMLKAQDTVSSNIERIPSDVGMQSGRLHFCESSNFGISPESQERQRPFQRGKSPREPSGDQDQALVELPGTGLHLHPPYSLSPDLVSQQVVLHPDFTSIHIDKVVTVTEHDGN